MTLHAKMEIAMPDLQQYPRNLKLIKNVEDTVVVLALKVFHSVNFFLTRNAQGTANEIKQLKKYIIRQSF